LQDGAGFGLPLFSFHHFSKDMEFSNTCFDTIVGLSNRDCDCFDTGRPEGSEESLTTFGGWQYEQFTCPEDQVGAWTITTAYTLPTDIAAKVQLFAAGTLLDAGTDFTKTGANTLSVTTPVAGAVYQIWYEARITTYETIPAYNVSQSGLYIADLMPEEDLAGLESCDETIWTLYQWARATAIKTLTTDLNVSLQKRFKTKYNAWAGWIGDKKVSERLTTTSQYAGIRIRTNGMRSGYLKIASISTYFQQSGTIAITIYDQDGAVVVPSFNVTTDAGVKANTAVNIMLPLLDDASSVQDYFLVYEYDSDNKPALNKVYCKPCGWENYTPTYNADTYELHGPVMKPTLRTGWHNYVAIGGWEGDSVSDFSDAPAEMSQYMNGLVLQIETGCDLAAGLCSMVAGFGSNPFAMSVATAVQHKAAELLVRKRLTTSQINRNNAVNREALATEAERWAGHYAEIMAYLTTNVPETANDCLMCRPKMQMKGILS